MSNEITNNNTTALVASEGNTLAPAPPNLGAFEQLPCTASLEIPVHGVTVARLLRLTPGEVIRTQWQQGSDIPMNVNGRMIGWTEIEVVDNRLAARLVQIA